MPPLSFLGAYCTGHHCFHPRPTIASSPDVNVNGIAVHRQTDALAVHNCGPSSHGGALAQGSTTVFVNGLGASRVGDPVDCGSFMIEGSTDTFVGG